MELCGLLTSRGVRYCGLQPTNYNFELRTYCGQTADRGPGWFVARNPKFAVAISPQGNRFAVRSWSAVRNFLCVLTAESVVCYRMRMSADFTASVSPSFIDLPDLAAARIGGEVIAANDDFFAPKENLVKASAPEWREGVYTDRGKWMDGWETRRRRTPGHDWAIVKLGMPGIARGVVIDTSFFTGNYPERASIEGCTVDAAAKPETIAGDGIEWTRLLPESTLKGNTLNPFPISSSERVTHVRLNIFPDGGVARLRVHGEVVPDEAMFAAVREVDLAALVNGGFVVSCSDMHYGNRQNLILPGRSTHMGDGWRRSAVAALVTTGR